MIIAPLAVVEGAQADMRLGIAGYGVQHFPVYRKRFVHLASGMVGPADVEVFNPIVRLGRAVRKGLAYGPMGAFQVSLQALGM